MTRIKTLIITAAIAAIAIPASLGAFQASKAKPVHLTDAQKHSLICYTNCYPSGCITTCY